MDQSKIRNVAIIAHVDHGKTTLVDQLFRQSGLFRINQHVEERLMDSMDLERERGITIMAKNGGCNYKDYLINIIDTPGHADFGGEVERVLNMADGALLLVDAAEGPMPQSYFVLKKALALNLPVIVVVNKIDKPMARCEWVVDQVLDLFIRLNAPEELLDFPVIYASARDGFATHHYDEPSDTIFPVFDKIIEYIPAPKGDRNGPLQMLVSTISYSSFLGRLAIGKITSGTIKINKDAAVARGSDIITVTRVTKLYCFKSNQRVETDEVQAGDICALAGVENIQVGDTITDKDNPIPLPSVPVDPPTISMKFLPNNSPFAGQDGDYVTSRHLRDRLFREILSDVALKVEELPGEAGFKVSGRGELHLSILIEKMRREGYEFQVSRPTVIVKEVDGKMMEPYEELIIDVDESMIGKVIEKLGTRKGQMINLTQGHGTAKLTFKIPTRGLLGYQQEFMMDTKGMGVMNYIFLEYGPHAGDIMYRRTGVMVVKEPCTTVAYALFRLQERGNMFMGAGEKVYRGEIIGTFCREGDLVVNPGKAKKMTNVRAAGSDENVILVPPIKMSLEQCISFIDDNELVEVTPKAVRLRKEDLSNIQGISND